MCELLCLGHPDRGDDALGFRVADFFGLRCLQPLDLIEAWRGRDVVLVDAVQTGQAPPGTVHVWHDPELLKNALTVSTHGFGAAEALALSERLGASPSRLTVIAVEAACFDAGTPMSPEVAAALPHVLRLTAERVRCPII